MNRATFSINAQTRIVGAENITIRDETLKTFKIERQAIATASVSAGMGYPVIQDISYLYYYAPNAGAIVKYDRKGGGSRVLVELLTKGHRR